MNGSGEAASVQGQICFALSFSSQCVANRTRQVYGYYLKGSCFWVGFLEVVLGMLLLETFYTRSSYLSTS